MFLKVLMLALLILNLSACQKQTLQEQMDAMFTEYSGNNMPGAALLIIQNDKILLSKGYGVANLEKNQPVSVTTNFRLASITKTITATAILQLVDAGQLSLETYLTDIWSEFPNIGAQITIRDLLRHTSGLLDYESLLPETQSDNQFKQVRDADVLQLLMPHDTTYFQSGSQYQYSNSGYALLALIIEKVTGLTYVEYLQKHIFKPAGMDSTIAYVDGINQVENRACGYSINDDGNVERTDQSRTSAVLGDGGVYSNLNDLYQWQLALSDHRILSSALRQESLSDQQTNQNVDIDYGFGWRLEKHRGLDVTYHTGSTKGFRNVFYRIPAEQMTIVILTNRNSYTSMTPLEMARVIAEQLPAEKVND